ncbi:ankyrin repeat domain-containing protein [Pseudoxanthomonas mexicana]|uniref:ankyrin repeat domain-containing protein n=1 Tax=Pseudoxanthomonas mexicana TaxID=128785 RepID=UPI000782863E|nr:ankyrin repeat domain-containing protein [Pseudoxanthomonas mexicana]
MAIHLALLDLVRELMSPKHLDFVALRRACGDAHALVDVLASGVDPNSWDERGASMLHMSGLSLDVVQLLLAAGADPDARWYGGHGRTPLFFATEHGVPTLLYHAGADLEARDVDGLTPLLFNIQYGAVELVEELLLLGADDAAQDDAGLGVLDYASLVATEATRQRLTDIFQRRHRSFVLREHLQGVASKTPTVVESPRRF